MRRSPDGMARFIGGAVKLAVPDAEVDTFARWGVVTLADGQVFRFAVEELDGADVAAKAAERPGEILDETPEWAGGAG